MNQQYNQRSNQLQQLFSEGATLLQRGNADEALVRFQSALDLDRSNGTLHLYAGAALHDLGRYEEAVASYQKALNCAPETGEIHNNLGNSLLALGRFAEAADCFSRAAGFLATSPVPLATGATALQALGKISEAEAACRKAIQLDPSFAAAHWNLALNLLLQGRYEEGWPEYDWRWRKPDFTSPCRHTDIPLWDGSPLEGRTILLHAEQGFGDAIQFIRYASLVAERGGTVIIECHPQLVRLFQSVSGIHSVVPFGAALPPFSCQAPLLTLPGIFGTTLQYIPSTSPYLCVSAVQQQKWSALMSNYPMNPRIGLVWAGKKYPDPLRSCHLPELAPLLSVKNVTFFSLQLGEEAGHVNAQQSACNLVDLTIQIEDFADTAALIEQLDLVISIDTAVAHLAGAMGKQVYLLLPFAPDWRWLLERTDSPWYPNTQIFRQKQPGDWDDVISRAQSALEYLCSKKKSFEFAPKD
ncbi:MAG TPA: glycosyltransferase family protein [Desulfuromonadales bacterium]|nr:glycosyltransferase family protein [Desulfuromonadales bacterium]